MLFLPGQFELLPQVFLFALLPERVRAELLELSLLRARPTLDFFQLLLEVGGGRLDAFPLLSFGVQPLGDAPNLGLRPLGLPPRLFVLGFRPADSARRRASSASSDSVRRSSAVI